MRLFQQSSYDTHNLVRVLLTLGVDNSYSWVYAYPTLEQGERKNLGTVKRRKSITPHKLSIEQRQEINEVEKAEEANKKSNGRKILLVILAVAIGLGIQVLLVPLVLVLGEAGALLGTVLGFVVMGSYTHGCHKVVSMLFMAKAALR